MNEAPNIASSFVVMSADFKADVVAVTDRLYAELEEKYGEFQGRTLISCHSFDDDWTTWEVHPKGDEFVVLLDGDVEMMLATESGEKAIHLNEPGSFVIVPRGVWHTAIVRRRAQMLFVTPGEGTENRAEPRRD